jgi:hypothetical protein
LALLPNSISASRSISKPLSRGCTTSTRISVNWRQSRGQTTFKPLKRSCKRCTINSRSSLNRKSKRRLTIPKTLKQKRSSVSQPHKGKSGHSPLPQRSSKYAKSHTRRSEMIKGLCDTEEEEEEEEEGGIHTANIPRKGFF